MQTFDDLEREAYIRGDTILADLYGQLSEVEYADGEIERLHDKINNLEWDVEYLSRTNENLEDDIEHWRKRAIKAEGKLEETQFILESLSK